MALDILTTLVEAGQKTIAFTKARRITELLYGWLQRKGRVLARRVACYRAGFLPEERREIEGKLVSGELDDDFLASARTLATAFHDHGVPVHGAAICHAIVANASGGELGLQRDGLGRLRFWQRKELNRRIALRAALLPLGGVKSADEA